MENITLMIQCVKDIMVQKFNVFGFSISPLNIFFFIGVSDIIAWIIARVLNDD